MGEFFSSIGSFFGSILSGGVTGLLGIVVQRVMDYKKLQLDLETLKVKNSHEVEMKKVDLQIMSEEWAQRTKIAQVEAHAEIEKADAAAFSASFNEPQKYSEGVELTRGQSWLMVILDFIRGIVRPGLTMYLCIVSSLIYLQIYKIVASNGNAAISAEDAAFVLKRIVDTILYLSTTTVLWWFGTRNKKKTPTPAL